MSSRQAIDVKLAPGLLTALRGPKLWASLSAATGVISFDNTVGLFPLWNGAAVDDDGGQDAWLINNVDLDNVGDNSLVVDATTGKFIFPLACVNTHLSNGNAVPIMLTDWWTTKFPSAVPEDLLTATFTLIVKNGAEQAYSMVTVHRLPSTVVVNSVTEQGQSSTSFTLYNPNSSWIINPDLGDEPGSTGYYYAGGWSTGTTGAFAFDSIFPGGGVGVVSVTAFKGSELEVVDANELNEFIQFSSNPTQIVTGSRLAGTINLDYDEGNTDVLFRFVLTVAGVAHAPIYLQAAFT